MPQSRGSAQNFRHLGAGAVELSQGRRIKKAVLFYQGSLKLQVGEDLTVVIRLWFKHTVIIDLARQNLQSDRASNITADQQNSLLFFFNSDDDVTVSACADT